jgi:hypothetical protein
VKRPELPAPTELVIVRPGSPETAGTRYLGLAEALDRFRGCQLRDKVRTKRWTMAEREAGLASARDRALRAAADHGFGWRPRKRASANAVRANESVQKPYIRPNLTFTHTLPVVVTPDPTPPPVGGDKTPR